MSTELQKVHNDKLLNSIYKNVQMALHAIHNIITLVENEELRKCILKQKDIYEDVSRSCEGFAQKYDIEISDIGPMLKAMSYMSIKTKGNMNKTASHHADMMIQGTTMGITDLIKDTSNFSLAEKNIIELAEKIKNSEEAFVESLKAFLKQ